MKPATLFLVPAPLDFGCDEKTSLDEVLPDATLRVVARLSHWVCENARSARAYLNRVNEIHPLALPLQQQQIVELARHIHKKGDHDGQYDARPLLAPAVQGHDMGLLSEAGMPAIADPGSSVVRAAHALSIKVVPLVGPVSLLLALAASGLNGQNFAFVGYLPQDSAQRKRRSQELETIARSTGQSQLFIETPYRNTAMFSALVAHLDGNTRLSVSSGMTLAHAQTRCATVAEWRQAPAEGAPSNSTPAVFAIGI